MVDISEAANFGAVTRVETDTIAIGGDEVNSPNLQYKQLVDRDRYLKLSLDRAGITPTSTAEEIRQAIGAAQGGSDATDIFSHETAQTLSRASIAQGRLTLATGDPIPSSDITAATTLYYTPYNGDLISLYNNTESRWDIYTFTERSLNISGLTGNTNYDIFIWDNAGTLTLEPIAWSNSGAGTSVRASAISRLNGIWVKTSDNRRYVGTIRTTVAGQCEDSQWKRFLWNENNQGKRIARRLNQASSWTYSAPSWRIANNDPDNALFFVLGLPQNIVAFNFASISSSMVAGSGNISISQNNSLTPVPGAFSANLGGGGQDVVGQNCSAIASCPIGYNSLSPIELGASSIVMTYYGSNSPQFPNDSVGMQAEILA